MLSEHQARVVVSLMEEASRILSIAMCTLPGEMRFSLPDELQGAAGILRHTFDVRGGEYRPMRTTLAGEALAAERERCAFAVWTHFMDTCANRGLAPADHGHWCATDVIRGLK